MQLLILFKEIRIKQLIKKMTLRKSSVKKMQCFVEYLKVG